ncbi:hypothetical protein K0U27_07265 [archaeon]|nr:hypothetical protein [archaeon]
MSSSSTWKNMDRPIAKITAAVSLIGTLGASFVMFYNDIVIPEAGYALIGSIVTGAVMFLFKRDGD